ncbi:MAG: ABC transporter ATP-binding protein [Anaerolineae bacterium]|nr:ABC transporter ATP-binding protein [Anaerolineae bacterium]
MANNDGRRPILVQVRSLTKIYEQGGRQLVVLDNVDLDIFTGEFLILLGSSGSGKSTLLNLLSGVDRADRGAITVNGTDITTLSEHERTIFRRDQMGIVFQFFNLIPTLTVLENVTLPYELRGLNHRQGQKLALAMLERVGLAERATDFPDRLSGGQQQRVAIARALVHEPMLVLADEPTGNLDEDTGQEVLSLLLELTRNAGKTLVMATHNPAIVPLADRVCRVQHGKLHLVAPSAEAFAAVSER